MLSGDPQLGGSFVQEGFVFEALCTWLGGGGKSRYFRFSRKKRVEKRQFLNQAVSPSSPGRFLKLWMFWNRKDFLPNLCMSDPCYNELWVPLDWKFDCSTAKLVISRYLCVPRLQIWCFVTPERTPRGQGLLLEQSATLQTQKMSSTD